MTTFLLLKSSYSYYLWDNIFNYLSKYRLQDVEYDQRTMIRLSLHYNAILISRFDKRIIKQLNSFTGYHLSCIFRIKYIPYNLEKQYFSISQEEIFIEYDFLLINLYKERGIVREYKNILVLTQTNFGSWRLSNVLYSILKKYQIPNCGSDQSIILGGMIIPRYNQELNTHLRDNKFKYDKTDPGLFEIYQYDTIVDLSYFSIVKDTCFCRVVSERLKIDYEQNIRDILEYSTEDTHLLLKKDT